MWIVGFLIVMLVGCTTAFQRADGTFDVPRNVEVRSPFGTNVGFVKLEHCLTAKKNQWGITEYTDCHLQHDWVEAHSQGQGGQVAAGALIGLGFGLGGAFGPSNGATASSSSSSSATSAVGHGHH